MKIDAHQHFWNYDSARDGWITENMSAIRRNFLPVDLQSHLQAAGFNGCIVVQADQSETENDFQLKNAEEFDFIKGVVGWVDLTSPQIEERLEYYSHFPKMKGFRHVLQGEPQRNFMLQPRFLHGIGKLAKFGFTYDILIFADQLTYIPTLVSQFPNQLFVIDHIAKPGIKNLSIKDWKKGIETVAGYQNVYCKISGMVTEADWQNWRPVDFTPYLDVVVNAFGTSRIMYGSDWPVCLLAADYNSVLSIVEQYFKTFSSAEQQAFFGGNASKFYWL